MLSEFAEHVAWWNSSLVDNFVVAVYKPLRLLSKKQGTIGFHPIPLQWRGFDCCMCLSFTRFGLFGCPIKGKMYCCPNLLFYKMRFLVILQG
jgi:hypothetical protein